MGLWGLGELPPSWRGTWTGALLIFVGGGGGGDGDDGDDGDAGDGDDDDNNGDDGWW